MQQCNEYEDFEFGVLSEQEIRLIMAEYSRQKLKESLIGPLISTFVHTLLIVLAVLFFQGEAVSKNAHVEITKMEEAPPVDVPHLLLRHQKYLHLSLRM
ncbi:hypothetical protein LNTAR_06434 [Lentisphaera araneosa HTCC2155]|uniref:Uncharacterized protein n=2 Tax=Lentisphaera TaxID=256846 RepID=A6DNB3_9BACT|nr:hypothetical protein LNTAR_06434 [Lentisphaera araneosa HTCC2155]